MAEVQARRALPFDVGARQAAETYRQRTALVGRAVAMVIALGLAWSGARGFYALLQGAGLPAPIAVGITVAGLAAAVLLAGGLVKLAQLLIGAVILAALSPLFILGLLDEAKRDTLARMRGA